MKWVIACLVVVNAVFLVWQLGRERPMAAPDEPEPVTGTSAMVNRLLLISELDRGVLRRRLGAEAQAAAPQAGSGAEARDTAEPSVARYSCIC